MKYLLAILPLVFCLSVEMAGAQGLSIGTRQGMGLSQLYATGNGFARDFAINQELNPGYAGGLIVQHMYNRTVGVQGGLMYINKGWSQILESGEVFSTDLNYVDLEALTHIQFGRGNFKVFIQGGIFGGYAISSSDNLADISAPETIRYSYDEESDNRLNYGLKGGAGVSLDTNIGVFQANFLFGQCLGSLIDTSTTTRALFSQLQTIEVGATYLVRIK